MPTEDALQDALRRGPARVFQVLVKVVVVLVMS
jgi:hypothetical protein